MPPALIIAQFAIQYGLPLATSLIEKWTKDEPDNPSAKEWLELIKKHPSATQTYDDWIKPQKPGVTP